MPVLLPQHSEAGIAIGAGSEREQAAMVTAVGRPVEAFIGMEGIDLTWGVFSTGGDSAVDPMLAQAQKRCAEGE